MDGGGGGAVASMVRSRGWTIEFNCNLFTKHSTLRARITKRRVEIKKNRKRKKYTSIFDREENTIINFTLLIYY